MAIGRPQSGCNTPLAGVAREGTRRPADRSVALAPRRSEPAELALVLVDFDQALNKLESIDESSQYTMPDPGIGFGS